MASPNFPKILRARFVFFNLASHLGSNLTRDEIRTSGGEAWESILETRGSGLSPGWGMPLKRVLCTLTLEMRVGADAELARGLSGPVASPARAGGRDGRCVRSGAGRAWARLSPAFQAGPKAASSSTASGCRRLRGLNQLLVTSSLSCNDKPELQI